MIDPTPVVSLTGLGKRYGDVAVFEGVNLSVQAGEFVAIVGDSGVGKSSLLNCLGGLDTWNEGHLHVCGQNLASLNDDALAHLRRAKIGFVFQAFHVLPHLDVAQNIGLPLVLLGKSLRDPSYTARVDEVMAAVGLDGLGTRLPGQLSGGQLQRVAIARAIVHRPALILADEPTGNLDPTTALRVMDVLSDQARLGGSALVLVTHSEVAAQRATRRLRLTHAGLEEIFQPTGDSQ